MALLEINDLHTFFKTKKGTVKAVNGVSYSVEPGKTLGVVGESGSGKSVSAMSILKLLDGNGYIDSGEIIFDGKNLADVSVKDMCKIRGNDISVIFQEPMTSLNPIFTVEQKRSGRKMYRYVKRRAYPKPGSSCKAVSASVIRWYAPACYDRNGTCMPAKTADRR